MVIPAPFERKSFGGRSRPEKDKDSPRVNREIRAPQVRVIAEDGTMLGVMTVPDAIRMAEDKGLDLLEVAPTAQPPTCKIMDYGKWKYENKKKAAVARKKQVIVQIKEVQLRPRTDQHDLDTKARHAKDFLLEGDKVKANLRFMGREMAHQDQGLMVLNKLIASLSDVGMVEVPPKLEGKQLFVLIAPDPAKIKEYLKQHPELKPKEKEKPEAE